MLEKAIVSGECDKKNLVLPSHSGSKKYIHQIEERNPGYLRYLFRYSQSVKGIRATYQELTDEMNNKSATPAETRIILNLSRKQVMDWFKAQGGKEYSPKEKPLDTPKQNIL